MMNQNIAHAPLSQDPAFASCSMIQCLQDRWFVLDNGHICLILYILDNQQPVSCYYGASLGELSEDMLEYLVKEEDKLAGTVKYNWNDPLTLADANSEYPVFAGGDFRIPALEVERDHTPLFLDLRLQGWSCRKGRPAIQGPHFKDDPQAETLCLRLQDTVQGLQVDLEYTMYPACGAIVRSNVITNIGTAGLDLTKAASVVFHRPDSHYEIVYLAGAWGRERMVKRTTADQSVVMIESRYGSSSHQHNPYISLEKQGTDLHHGDAYGCNLVYSASFQTSIESNEWGSLRIMSGIQPDTFSWHLEPGDAFRTPDALMSYSSQGVNGLAQANSQVVARHLLKEQPRPIVLNSWEAFYFDFDQERLLELAEKARDCGMECFVLDDGWFASRDVETCSLGDWFVSSRKFPDGIGAFAKKIHAMGLQFGMWFEPEMISPISELYETHPEWVLRPSEGRYSYARSQLVLDFANPAVVDYIYGLMKTVIEEAQLDYIKWDMNRNITEAWSPYLHQMGISQKEVYYRNIYGVYSLYEKIQKDFPDLFIEGCASGGARFDLGILYYSPQIWTSDDTDAIERLKIQYGTSLAYPLLSMSNHVSAVPNHQASRITPLETRENAAFFGSLGYELDLCACSAQDLEEVRRGVDFYKRFRTLLGKGTFYRLLSPFEGERNECAWALVAGDEICVAYFQVLNNLSVSSKETLPLPFVQPDAVYEVEGEILSGALLRQFGLRKPVRLNGANQQKVRLKGDFQSCLFHIRKVSRG